MSIRPNRMRGGFARLSLVILILFIFSCSWFREDTEVFYYRYALHVLEKGVEQKIRDRCHFTTDLEYPTFSNTPKTDLDYLYRELHLPYRIGGFYSESQKKIVYSKWRPEVISHETVHHLDYMNRMSRDCLVEFLAEMTQHAVEQDLKIMYLQGRLQQGR